tara:strand:- start:1146 stop:3974 length:2829 start_codon:yes stop_codon:yes gene_type:complete
MQISAFLRHVWPSQGVYCIVGKDPANNILPKFVHTIEEAEQVAISLVEDNYDVYFACSTYQYATQRTKANTSQQKALWLDIDCGYDEKKKKYKDYHSKEDAIDALKEFTKVTKLPKPTIVDSGRGIHCYWTLTEPVTTDVWEGVAGGLKMLCVKHGLHADPVCTADAARILRVPATKNFKDVNDPLPVKILTEGEPTPFDEMASLVPYYVATKPQTNRKYSEAASAELDNHSARFIKIVNKGREGNGCDQINHIMANQKNIDYGLWRSGLSIAVFCEDHDVAIHKMSSLHPEYTRENTIKVAEGIPKPHTCGQFESLRPEGCAKCKYKGTINSPIKLGKVVAKARGADNVIEAMSEELGEVLTYQIPEYPYPYFRGKNGGIYKAMDDDDDDGLKIYDYDFYLVDRLNDPAVGDCAWFKLHLPQDAVREFIAPVASLLSTEKARDIVNNIGIFERGKSLDSIISYMRCSLTDRQKTKEATLMHKQFGWNAEMNKIIIGNREVTAFGSSYVPVSEDLDQITKTLNKKGSYDEWKKAITFYERPGMELRAFGFFCGFGSLLMPLFKSKEKSAVINMYHPESGQGKTSILQMMTSIWGNPDLECKLINLWGDTENSIINRLGYMKNIPAAVDEMTGVMPDELHRFLKFIASGRGKNRLGNGANKERDNDTIFNLICVVSSNTDFRTVMYNHNAKASGEMARFIQLRIERDNTLSKAEIDELISKIFDNYGHAGEQYAQYIIQNIDKVREDLLETQIKIDKMMNFQGLERKYSTNLAAVFLGAIIAKRLGIHNIPIDPVLKAVGNEIRNFRTVMRDNDFNALGTLGDFITENYARNTLVINGKTDIRTGFNDAAILRPSSELRMRYEPDLQAIYIPCSVIKTYLKGISVEYNDFVKGLKDEALLLPRSGDAKAMHKGLNISGPTIRCLWINSNTFDVKVPEEVAHDS